MLDKEISIFSSKVVIDQSNFLAMYSDGFKTTKSAANRAANDIL